MQVCPIRALPACLVFCASSATAQIEITVANPKGAPLKDALVIIHSLQPSEHELFRVLTDETGKIPQHNLDRGLYRAVGTFPYSRWQTAVCEFPVSKTPVKVELQLPEKTIENANHCLRRKANCPCAGCKGPAGGRSSRSATGCGSSPRFKKIGARPIAHGVTNLRLASSTAASVIVYRDQLYTFPVNAWETERTVRLKEM